MSQQHERSHSTEPSTASNTEFRQRVSWSAVHFQGHCSSNTDGSLEQHGTETQITPVVQSRRLGEVHSDLPCCCCCCCCCFCRCSRCRGWFLSSAAQRAAFLRGAAQSRGRQSVSWRQPGTAEVMGVAVPSSRNSSTTTTEYDRLACYSIPSKSVLRRYLIQTVVNTAAEPEPKLVEL